MAGNNGDMYWLNGIAHVAEFIDERSTRRQQKIIMHDRILLYLDSAGLLHVARLNDYWINLDEPLFSAFMERWCPEIHTFHMSFGECTVTLQDVAYQFGLPVDGFAVSGCLSDFEQLIEREKPTQV
ncbi:protein MAIN-LIKE 1-like [Arachis ipaensis]|uniref:protein MAIN-LIKE 1-like n=1 Tax=Arachis ipaensis TaxID=130454 RepID=UPI000A2AF949|nr:protein MAIN-LIKE 1-like [Arachis ipaensis]XP_025661846.1 protein MAIN-LIKE 1-like [Arachis hypogaea]